MGISETVVAAIIGALATMLTAIFQLVRNRAPSETRPKKKRLRSLVATIALMIGCIVGGYAWSTLRGISAKDEMRVTMETELTKQFADFAARQRQLTVEAASAATADAGDAVISARHGETGSAESLAQLPPCRIAVQPDEVGPITCSERVAQTIALCAAIPSTARVANVRLQARVPNSESPWLERDAGSATLGSLRIGATASESPISADQRSVCLDVSNWSVDDTLAVRVIVDYAFGSVASGELTAAAPGAHTL
jgi:hypothetical protein